MSITNATTQESLVQYPSPYKVIDGNLCMEVTEKQSTYDRKLSKKVYGKDNGFFFYHYAQSFSPSEKITPEQAHEIALEFAEKAWTGHEVLVTTHCDANHIHSHFVINSVGFESGMKLRQSPSTLKKLRKLSDEICIAHGLSVLQPYQGGKNSISSREYRVRLKGNSWKA